MRVQLILTLGSIAALVTVCVQQYIDKDVSHIPRFHIN